MKTRATQDGSDWIISGSKTYISNGQIADVVLVAARTVPDSPRGIGLFLIEEDMPGFRRGRKLKKMGLDAQDTSELFFDDVHVPATNVLGDPSGGFRSLMQFLAQERVCSAAGAIASAQLAFDLTLEFVRNRHVFGRRLSTMQNTRFKMAAMRAELDVVQSFVDQCALELNRGRLSGADAAKVKLLASELQGRVVDECLQLYGGAGYMEEYPICRLYRDARVARIYAGTSEVMKEIISRDIGMD
jgi:acyl-CoA dehydrogenase